MPKLERPVLSLDFPIRRAQMHNLPTIPQITPLVAIAIVLLCYYLRRVFLVLHFISKQILRIFPRLQVLRYHFILIIILLRMDWENAKVIAGNYTFCSTIKYTIWRFKHCV